MKKIFMIAIVALFGMQMAEAQYTTAKYTLAVGEFTGQKSDEMRKSIMTQTRSCRVNVVDLNDLKDSASRSKVDYIVSGAIEGLTVEKKANDKFSKALGEGDSYFSGSIKYSLVLTDAHKGAVVSKMNNRIHSKIGSSEEEATNGAASVDPFDMEDLLNMAVKVMVPITDYKLNEKGKKSVEEVVVKMESNVGLCSGMRFEIQIEQEEYGVKTYKKVGDAKFNKSLGEQVVVLTVSKGNKDVYKYNDQEIPMIVTTRELNMIEKIQREAEGIFKETDNGK